MAFEEENGDGEEIVIAFVTGFRVMLTEPELEEARPVVWKRVVMRAPEGGTWWRSEEERYWRRMW